ncbi:hypothetical protein B0H15DRAFT_934783 [Mycena belliarum]|uniref:Uncharacterized protein n=1 Tax=Mycena belliarum TaxID=1033014 RepID=A0AAD6TRB0_9AGAR|nr:hypothetical protein B0H15DRAFT_934783 [Mycena belliae]
MRRDRRTESREVARWGGWGTSEALEGAPQESRETGAMLLRSLWLSGLSAARVNLRTGQRRVGHGGLERRAGARSQDVERNTVISGARALQLSGTRTDSIERFRRQRSGAQRRLAAYEARAQRSDVEAGDVASRALPTRSVFAGEKACAACAGALRAGVERRVREALEGGGAHVGCKGGEPYAHGDDAAVQEAHALGRVCARGTGGGGRLCTRRAWTWRQRRWDGRRARWCGLAAFAGMKVARLGPPEREWKRRMRGVGGCALWRLEQRGGDGGDAVRLCERRVGVR